mmetsp:Transcript_17387/g.55837  ORF Transcript_17387/g.55837 Transcript_17387/m.55837 type:complete len:349 (+) Transcript_17387:448-1494(+)
MIDEGSREAVAESEAFKAPHVEAWSPPQDEGVHVGVVWDFSLGAPALAIARAGGWEEVGGAVPLAAGAGAPVCVRRVRGPGTCANVPHAVSRRLWPGGRAPSEGLAGGDNDPPRQVDEAARLALRHLRPHHAKHLSLPPKGARDAVAHPHLGNVPLRPPRQHDGPSGEGWEPVEVMVDVAFSPARESGGARGAGGRQKLAAFDAPTVPVARLCGHPRCGGLCRPRRAGLVRSPRGVGRMHGEAPSFFDLALAAFPWRSSPVRRRRALRSSLGGRASGWSRSRALVLEVFVQECPGSVTECCVGNAHMKSDRRSRLKTLYSSSLRGPPLSSPARGVCVAPAINPPSALL